MAVEDDHIPIAMHSSGCSLFLTLFVTVSVLIAHTGQLCTKQKQY